MVNDLKAKKGKRDKYWGIVSQVSRDLKLSRSFVSRVLHGHKTSARVLAALAAKKAVKAKAR